MDIVIPLGKASPWNNHELRYALRSIEQNAIGYDRIFIVGEKPKWINWSAIGHFGFKEKWQKEKNIMMKVLGICGNGSGVSDQFLFTNDDIFFTRPVEISKIPFYRKKKVLSESAETCPSKAYQKSLKNTSAALLETGHNEFHFDVHTPIVYDRRKFHQAMNSFDWDVDRGYVIKSLYSNFVGITGEEYEDCKIDKPLTVDEIKNIFEAKPFVSLGDAGLNDAFKNVLKTVYPKKSRYEL